MPSLSLATPQALPSPFTPTARLTSLHHASQSHLSFALTLLHRSQRRLTHISLPSPLPKVSPKPSSTSSRTVAIVPTKEQHLAQRRLDREISCLKSGIAALAVYLDGGRWWEDESCPLLWDDEENAEAAAREAEAGIAMAEESARIDFGP